MTLRFNISSTFIANVELSLTSVFFTDVEFFVKKSTSFYYEYSIIQFIDYSPTPVS